MNAAALIALQEIDSALDLNANRRPRLPEVAAHAQAVAALKELQAQMAAAQQRIDTAQTAIEGAEHAAAELTTKRTRLEAQLKTVIAPREAEALMHQIQTINGQRSELDDQELAALEEQAAGDETLTELQAAAPAAESAVTAAAAALATATAELDAEAAALAARRIDAVAAMTPAEVALFERVRRQFGGVGVARLEHGHHCSGCHMDLSPAEMDVVKAVPAGEVAECPQCGRLMVR